MEGIKKYREERGCSKGEREKMGAGVGRGERRGREYSKGERKKKGAGVGKGAKEEKGGEREKEDRRWLFVRELEYLSSLPPITVILASSVFTLLK